MNQSETKEIIELLTHEEVSLLVAAYQLVMSGSKKEMCAVFAALNPCPTYQVWTEREI